MIYTIKIKNSIHSLNGYIILILINSISFCVLQGQATGDAKEDFLYGEFYIEQGLYKKALPFYLSALKANETNCNICYRVGECYLNILGEEDKALPYLVRAVRNVDENYIPGRYKNIAAPPVAWMLLGDAYHRNNNLSDASFAYHKYKKFVNPSDKQQVESINKRIVGVGISYEFQREKQDVYMYNFGSKINTRFSEYNAVLSGDQLTMVYTAFWEAYDKIFVSYRQSDGWTDPVEINNQVGSDGNCYTTALSYDGTELYLIKQLSDFNSDIYVSLKKDGEWQKMTALSKKINSSSLETSACVSSDGTLLYFSSNKSSGEGGFDLYVAKKENSTWTDVENLGVGINTAKDEEAPYISEDNNTLYFSSNGHETIGRMDILFSDRDENGNWGRPQNMGTPYNTTDDDVFMVYFKNTQTGYISREGNNSFGKQDIYVIQIGNYIPDWIKSLEQHANVNIDSLKRSSTQVFGIDNTYQKKKQTEEVIYIDSLKQEMLTQNEEERKEVKVIEIEGDEPPATNLSDSKSSINPTKVPAISTNVSPATAVATGTASVVASTAPASITPTITVSEDEVDPNMDKKTSTKETQLLADNKSSSSKPVKKAKEKPEEKTESPKKHPITIDNTYKIPSTASISTNKSTSTKMEEKVASPNKLKKIEDSSYKKYTTNNTIKTNQSIKHQSKGTLFTIQIIALQKPRNASYFIPLQDITVSKGNDGYYRYTIGEYDQILQAISEMNKLRSIGFDEAFIRNTKHIENYKIDCEYSHK